MLRHWRRRLRTASLSPHIVCELSIPIEGFHPLVLSELVDIELDGYQKHHERRPAPVVFGRCIHCRFQEHAFNLLTVLRSRRHHRRLQSTIVAPNDGGEWRRRQFLATVALIARNHRNAYGKVRRSARARNRLCRFAGESSVINFG